VEPFGGPRILHVVLLLAVCVGGCCAHTDTRVRVMLSIREAPAARLLRFLGCERVPLCLHYDLHRVLNPCYLPAHSVPKKSNPLMAAWPSPVM
jgi:hypothetical protein